MVLKKWNLSNSTFIESEFKNITFINCKLESISLNGAELTNVHFKNSFCRGTVFKKVKFDKCNLFGVKFENADLKSNNFTSCQNVNNAEFKKANLERALFSLDVNDEFLGAANSLKSINFSEKIRIWDLKLSNVEKN